VLKCVQLHSTAVYCMAISCGLEKTQVWDFLESRWQCGGQGFEPPQLHNRIAHKKRPLTCEDLVGGRSWLFVRCGQWHVKTGAWPLTLSNRVRSLLQDR
jgi:hypothetical protein